MMLSGRLGPSPIKLRGDRFADCYIVGAREYGILSIDRSSLLHRLLPGIEQHFFRFPHSAWCHWKDHFAVRTNEPNTTNTMEDAQIESCFSLIPMLQFDAITHLPQMAVILITFNHRYSSRREAVVETRGNFSATGKE
jgi:hypothetical protein